MDDGKTRLELEASGENSEGGGGASGYLRGGFCSGRAPDSFGNQGGDRAALPSTMPDVPRVSDGVGARSSWSVPVSQGLLPSGVECMEDAGEPPLKGDGLRLRSATDDQVKRELWFAKLRFFKWQAEARRRGIKT
jgi:hypothetical protein